MTLTRQVFHTPTAPAAIGPYSQAIIANGFIFTAGQTGTNPETRALADGLEAQTRQTLENIRAILEGAGSSLSRVVKATVYLKSMDDFAAMNGVYGQFFPSEPPARTTIAAANLPGGALIEIEVIALVS